MEKIINQAIKAIENNLLIVLPTDTVYGIGVSPKNPENIKAILKAKGRDGQKPPPILVANIDQAQQIAEIDQKYLPVLEKFWPGALTLIFPMKQNLGWDLGEKNSTIAVRMPDNDLTLKLLSQAGPLAVTSANLTKCKPATNVKEAEKYFGDKVSTYIDGGESKLGLSSTIVDLSVQNPIILRFGDISKDDLKHYLPRIQ